jgi:hypothetical protein
MTTRDDEPLALFGVRLRILLASYRFDLRHRIPLLDGVAEDG